MKETFCVFPCSHLISLNRNCLLCLRLCACVRSTCTGARTSLRQTWSRPCWKVETPQFLFLWLQRFFGLSQPVLSNHPLSVSACLSLSLSLSPQPSPTRRPSWRRRWPRSRGTAADWPWSKSRRPKPDWTCWVSFSSSCSSCSSPSYITFSSLCEMNESTSTAAPVLWYTHTHTHKL